MLTGIPRNSSVPAILAFHFCSAAAFSFVSFRLLPDHHGPPLHTTVNGKRKEQHNPGNLYFVRYFRTLGARTSLGGPKFLNILFWLSSLS